MSDDKLVPRDNSLPELTRVHQELAKWRGKAFLLTPYARTQFDSIKPGYRPEFRVTYVSPDPKDQQVYELDKQPDKLVLTKIGLQLLDHLAGIRWIRVFTALEAGDVVDPYFCKKGAEGAVQDLDGAYRNSICTATLDLREGSTTTAKMLKQSPDGRQLTRARLNIVSQTETLAKNKVRRELLGLQATFTRKELTDKPFVILKLNPAQDMNDPIVRKLTIMQQFNISSELYDQVAGQLSGPVIPEVPVIDVTPTDTPAEPKPTKEELIREVAENLTPAERRQLLVAFVEALYKKKVKGGRNTSKPPLDSLKDSELEKIAELLAVKPDLEQQI